MAEFLNRELRVNEAAAALKTLAEESKKRVPAPASGPAYQTLPNGNVVDRSGVEVYSRPPLSRPSVQA